MYKATNVDTDKALKAIETFRKSQSNMQQHEFYGIQKYYEGVEVGLSLAESLFTCSEYEDDEPKTTHTKIQYNDHEYTISELCKRLAELEQLVIDNEWGGMAEMLVPAILYKDEIHKKFMEYGYTEDMTYYMGWLGCYPPNINAENDGNGYDYAINNNNKLIGYFSYRVDWYVSCAHQFGLFSFDRGNRIIGLDVYRELKKLINDYHLHRIEWRMIGGNPVERHYDKFCNKYNGKKFVLTDAIRDRQGNYHDDVIYEIILKGDNSHA